MPKSKPLRSFYETYELMRVISDLVIISERLNKMVSQVGIDLVDENSVLMIVLQRFHRLEVAARRHFELLDVLHAPFKCSFRFEIPGF